MPAMISTEAKIYETLNHGCVPVALKANFFTPLELLNYLATIADETLNLKLRFQAYACLREVLPPAQQFMADGQHFLIAKPEYASVFLGIFDHNLMAHIPVHLDQPESTIFESEAVRKVIHKFATDTSHRRFIEDILGNFLNTHGEPIDLKPDVLMNAIKIRSAPEIFFRELFEADTYNAFMVLGDWTDNLRMNTKLLDYVLKRVRMLSQKAPLYYARVAYPLYHKVVVELNKQQLLRLPKADLIDVNKFFPNIIDARILALTPEVYNIFELGTEGAGYVLGFPIQNGITTVDDILAALSKLQQIGVVAYAEALKAYIQRTYEPSAPLFAPADHKFKYLNDTDVFLEDIRDYVPFDVVAYTSGTFVYRFARTEFKNLLKTGKNSWTNEELPVGILATMRARMDAAKALGLPKPKIFTDLISEIMNPKPEVYEGAYVFEPAPGFMGARIPWNTNFLQPQVRLANPVQPPVRLPAGYQYPTYEDMHPWHIGHDERRDATMPELEDADADDEYWRHRDLYDYPNFTAVHAPRGESATEAEDDIDISALFEDVANSRMEEVD